MQLSTEVPALMLSRAATTAGVELPRRQPRILVLLIAVQVLARFAWSGAAALLSIYLISAVGVGADEANGLFVVYLGAFALTPLLGGWMGDRLLGMRRAAGLGAALVAAGCVALAASAGNVAGDPLLVALAGAALLALGAGLFEPTFLTLVGEIYDETDRGRDAGFTLVFAGARAGVVLGILVVGGLAATLGFAVGFAAAAAAGAIGTVLVLFARGRAVSPVGEPPEARTNPWIVVGVPVLGGSALGLGFVMAERAIASLGIALGGALIFGAVTLAFGLWLSDARLTRAEKARSAVLFLAACFVVVFWSSYDRAMVAIPILTDRPAPATSPPWTRMMTSGVAVLAASALALLWMRLGRRSREPGTIAKMALGLLVLGPAFGVLWVAGIRVDRLEPVAPALVYGGLALFAVAEASLAPAGHSLVTKLAPARWASTAMGALLLSRAGGARLALAMGVLMPRGEGLAARPATAVPTWSSFFLLFLGTAVAAGVTLLILEPFLHRWTGRD